MAAGLPVCFPRRMGMPGPLKRIGMVLGVRWLRGASPGAHAEAPVSSDVAALTAQKNALFQQMLREPANLSVTFAYADISTRLGDNEAAVSALERLLLFNPNLPRLDLELGVLYYRMGSFEAARSYLQKAAALNPPPDVRAHIDQYLAKITTVDAPQRLTGYVLFGAQYQSDMTVSSGSTLIKSAVADHV